MSSGSETRRKTARLPVRVAPDEMEQFRAAAIAAGFASVGDFVRSRCLAPGPKASAARSSQVDRAELVRVLGQLGKYGGNLNQIARAANAGGDPIRADQVHELHDQVREIAAMVRKALGRDRQG
jgi:hypothetical protein